MGYYTTFDITTDDYNTSEHIDAIQSLSGYEYGFQDVKWYKHEQDMKEYSKRHPTVLFTVDWDGEEQGDSGTRYFKNGKMQVCKAEMIVAPFDESKLA
jgi:hypothetical protein